MTNRPTLVGASSEKTSFDWAQNLAQKNNLKFFSLESKSFAQYEKHFYSGALDGQKTLFYLSEANALTVAEAQKFLELIKDSQHTFVLSTTSLDINWFLKKSCTIVQLDKINSELNSQLKLLLTEKDRNKVRKALQDADAVHLFHILKAGAWQVPQTLDTLIRINRMLYIVKKDYILDLLAYAIEAKPYATFQTKREENKMQKSIKVKLKEMYPKFHPEEIADTFLLMSNAHVSLGLDLSEEEKLYLKIPEKIVEEEVFVKAVDLRMYF
jgi:hypothetical protein